MLQNVLQPFLPSGRTRWLEPALSERQIHIVTNHEQLFRRNTVEADRLGDADSAAVHICLRHDQKYPLASNLAIRDFRLKLLLGLRRRISLAEDGNDVEANIVAGSLIPRTRISKSDYEFHQTDFSDCKTRLHPIGQRIFVEPNGRQLCLGPVPTGLGSLFGHQSAESLFALLRPPVRQVLVFAFLFFFWLANQFRLG